MREYRLLLIYALQPFWVLTHSAFSISTASPVVILLKPAQYDSSSLISLSEGANSPRPIFGNLPTLPITPSPSFVKFYVFLS